MPDPLFIDTNVFIRALTGEPAAMAAASQQLIERAEAGDLTLCTSHLTIAEIVWTLGSLYHESRPDIAIKVRDLIGMRSLQIDHRDMLLEVVDLYASSNVDFIDAYNALDARRRGISRVISYDHDFDALPVQRVDPADALA